MAFCGMKSQLTMSPKTSLIRTPFWYTASPCGVPMTGEANVTAIVQIKLEIVPSLVAQCDEGYRLGYRLQQVRRLGVIECRSPDGLDVRWNLVLLHRPRHSFRFSLRSGSRSRSGSRRGCGTRGCGCSCRSPRGSARRRDWCCRDHVDLGKSGGAFLRRSDVRRHEPHNGRRPQSVKYVRCRYSTMNSYIDTHGRTLTKGRIWN